MLKVIRKFFTFCGEENRRKFITSIRLNVIQALFEALKIPAIAVMIRALMKGTVDTKDILLSLGIMLISIAGSGLLKSKAVMLQTEGGYDACAKKRVEIAEHMRYLQMGYFNANSLGQITSVTTNIMESLENIAARVVMLVCDGLLTTSLIVVMLFFFDWRIACVLLCGFSLFLFANSRLRITSEKVSGKKIRADERLVEKVLEYLQGMTEVKAYRLTGVKSRELNEAIAENSKINIDMEMTLVPRIALQSFITKLTGVAMVAFSCVFYCAGSMDALNAVVMVISAFIIYTSLETAGQYSSLLRVVDMSVDRAQEILNTPQMDISGETIEPAVRDIVAQDIAFSYEKRKIIDGISLHIPEKTTTAIVGPSGGGKTTLVNLLARFWDVDGGTVMLGGRDVKDYDMDSLMANFSFVFQSVYLFHDTIANNIRFGQPGAPMEDVIAAAKKACCHDFISSLPHGYDTVVGEGGASLSGGEKQRISIARAMMKNAPVIFLDEATANVDPENENELMHAIHALTAEKTVIMIAHRLKTVERADQIIVVDHGKIVQQGTHAELMEQDGIYRNFIGERREAASWKVHK
ncbi:ABC transporter ATP-binding protein [Treponema putidum]|uniref:ABC transporter ATP-binding protein n=1 Tax=Treponema putidum TaxID=221027 RepID=UPI0004F70FA1|nr:ABC transporter ATP-binding protein [Treponema putidum]AIN93254.1 multidrug ABC transporter ATP-binding protein [Treponema putidum]TWI76621.1 ATP-binding cassette subfamily B protein [Treponema putidum]